MPACTDPKEPPATGVSRAPATAPVNPGADNLLADEPELRFVIGGLAAALCIAALHFGKDVLAPLAVAALLAFVMAPAVARLRRWRLPPLAAVGSVVGGTLVLSIALAVLVGQQLRVLGQDLPSYQKTIQSKLRALRPSGQPGALHDGLRLLGVVESEIEAARRALAATAPASTSSATARPAAVQRVQVEPTPATPLQAMGGLAATVLLPLAQVGLVVVLVFFMLLQRHEIRDRVLRVMGNDLSRSAYALNDAAGRVSRLLVAQLLVNAGYALPLALGLWWIGVPGAWLWGLLGGVLRFVPYLGPAVAGLCPLVLAFAVDPGWEMVAQTLLLVLVLELLLNNVIEPMAYSRGTGVSSMAVLVSAGFWSLIWGVVGLAIATPLTVLLVVLGRHLGPLRILDQLLGSEPAFNVGMRLHQRLISGDVEEALELADQAHTPAGLVSFFDRAGLAALQVTLDPLRPIGRADHRHRVVSGMARLLQGLRQDGPPLVAEGPFVLCAGARNEFDTLSAEMLAHALRAHGVPARVLPAAALAADRIGDLALDGVAAVCVCSFSPTPLTHTRFVLRRLRRRVPGLPVLLTAWDRDAELGELVGQAGASTTGTVGPFNGLMLAASVHESLARLRSLMPPQADLATVPDALAGASDVTLIDALSRGAQRALDVFGVDVVTLIFRDSLGSVQHASAGLPSRIALDPAWLLGEGSPVLAALAGGQPLCVPDVARDAGFGADHPLAQDGMRFFAAAPLRDPAGQVVGALALHALVPRSLRVDELNLLARMTAETGPLLEATAGHVAPVAHGPG